MMTGLAAGGHMHSMGARSLGRSAVKRGRRGNPAPLETGDVEGTRTLDLRRDRAAL